jgi:uncharacterized protein YggE
MKKLFGILPLFFLSQILTAQLSDRSLNTIDVIGSSKLTVIPESYKAQILIQEEEQKINYQTIGKLSIDSVKNNFFRALKKYNIDEKDLKIVGFSSRELGQYPNFLSNIAYELSLKNRQQGVQLINELRFPGIKGIIVRGQYPNAPQQIPDSLYELALKDAYRNAQIFARKVNKTIGEVKNIQLQERTIPSVGRDLESYGDIYNAYSLARFEMDLRDKMAYCTIRVTYELK